MSRYVVEAADGSDAAFREQLPAALRRARDMAADNGIAVAVRRDGLLVGTLTAALIWRNVRDPDVAAAIERLETEG